MVSRSAWYILVNVLISVDFFVSFLSSSVMISLRRRLKLTLFNVLTSGKNLFNFSVRRIFWCWSVVMVFFGVKRVFSRYDKTR